MGGERSHETYVSTISRPNCHEAPMRHLEVAPAPPAETAVSAEKTVGALSSARSKEDTL